MYCKAMVQEFMILRCFSCTTFQVHQVKKSKKWICKVCGEKQSIKKIYGQGSGQDCRKHVQELNLKCGEAQAVKDLTALDCHDNNDYGNVSENMQSAGNIAVNGRSPTCEDNTTAYMYKPPTIESKWKMFLENMSSSDDNGTDIIDGFNVTTERDAFNKATKGARRKWAQHGSKTSSYHKQKRPKNSIDVDQVIAGKLYSKNTENVTGNTVTGVRYTPYFVPNQRKQAYSGQTFELDGAILNKEYTEVQSPTRLLPLQANHQYKCNVHFARATRDVSSSTRLSGSMTNQGMKISSSSKWAKFMSSCSSSENKPLEDSDTINSSTEETLVQNEYLLVGTEFPVAQCEEISQPQNCEHNAGKLASCTMNERKPRSQLVEDFFKVNDDLDEEWWNSL